MGALAMDIRDEVQALLANGPSDLRALNLVRADLSGLDLSECDLSGQDLSQANLRGARLVHADLTQAVFFQTDLSDAQLMAAQMEGADLSEVKATRAGFGHCEMRGAILSDGDFQEASFSGAKLQGAILSAGRFQGARMHEAQLQGAEATRALFEGADLSEAEVAGASFREADLRNARLTHVRGYEDADWVMVDVRGADWRGSSLFLRHVQDQNYLWEFRTKSRNHAITYAIWKATSDCGNSLSRWGLWTALIAALFAGIYEHLAVDFAGHTAPLTSLYFSVVTLTTLGFGDVLPASGWAQLAVMCEVVMGYVMLGGLLSIFANKMARRA